MKRTNKHDPAFSATYEEALAKRLEAAVDAFAAAAVPYHAQSVPVARDAVRRALLAVLAAL
jgi:hypothetical protein